MIDPRAWFEWCSILVTPGNLGLPRGRLLLTLDDGPNANNATTARLLSVLREVNARACFCVIGRRAERHPDLVRAIAAEGHVIVNHGYAHLYPFGYGVSDLRSEIELGAAALRQVLGPEVWLPPWYRPAGGLVPALLREAAAEAGVRLFPPVTGYARDANGPAGPAFADRIVARIVRQVRHDGGGSIVLHDGCEAIGPAVPGAVDGVVGDRSWVPDALRRILETLSAEGIQPIDARAWALNELP